MIKENFFKVNAQVWALPTTAEPSEAPHCEREIDVAKLFGSLKKDSKNLLKIYNLF